MSGNKWMEKKYWRHTGFFGGIKSIVANKLRDEKPEEVITHAVRGMLPRGPLGRRQLKKLNVYAGTEHPHTAQQPIDHSWS
jgi:large subunit ribosomal protein L13